MRQRTATQRQTGHRVAHTFAVRPRRAQCCPTFHCTVSRSSVWRRFFKCRREGETMFSAHLLIKITPSDIGHRQTRIPHSSTMLSLAVVGSAGQQTCATLRDSFQANR